MSKGPRSEVRDDVAASGHDVEEAILHDGAHTVASGLGIAALAASFAGPEGAIAGALVGAIFALVLPRLKRRTPP